MEEVNPGKTPERDSTQKGQMKSQKKAKHEIAESKKWRIEDQRNSKQRRSARETEGN